MMNDEKPSRGRRGGSTKRMPLSEDEAIWLMAEQGLREYEASVARGEEPHRVTTVEAFMAWLDAA